MEPNETYRLLGNIALVALVLSALLLATGAPVLLIRAAQVSGIVAFILNRRKRIGYQGAQLKNASSSENPTGCWAVQHLW